MGRTGTFVLSSREIFRISVGLRFSVTLVLRQLSGNSWTKKSQTELRIGNQFRWPAAISRLHFEGCRETDGPNFEQHSESGFSLFKSSMSLRMSGSENLAGLDSSCALNSIRRTKKCNPRGRKNRSFKFRSTQFLAGWLVDLGVSKRRSKFAEA